MGDAPECCNAIFDFRYTRSMQAYMKGIEVVFCILNWLMSTDPEMCEAPSIYGGFNWMCLMAGGMFVIMYMLKLFRLDERLFFCQQLHFSFIEYILHCVTCFILFIFALGLTYYACGTLAKILMVGAWILVFSLFYDIFVTFTVTSVAVVTEGSDSEKPKKKKKKEKRESKVDPEA